MSFIPKTKKQLLAEGFTHYSSLWGIPCYIGDIESEAPMVAAANFIPDWLLDVGDFFYFSMLNYKHRDDPSYQPMFQIRIGAKIEVD